MQFYWGWKVTSIQIKGSNLLCKSSGFFVLFWFWVFRVFFSRIISFQFMVTLENISFVKEQHVTDYSLKILLVFFSDSWIWQYPI